MKKTLLALILLSLILPSCHKKDDLSGIDFRGEMRLFVEQISQYAKQKHSGFVIIPQNGVEILSSYPDTLVPDIDYLNAIDAQSQEDLLYGYDGDDKPTPADVTQYLKQYLDLALNSGKTILVTDYCWTDTYVSDSYSRNNSFGYISFAAPSRELDVIPADPPYNVNSNDIFKISDAKNYLYIINTQQYATRQDFLAALQQTDYDVIIMDAFFEGTEPYTADEIASLKTKANGGRRLVIAYMSIGEAEDYRYYWNPDWSKNPPDWLESENPLWKGNYKVRYWDPQWKQIIFGTPDSYLDKILEMNFDGVFLDIIDAFEYFEENYG